MSERNLVQRIGDHFGLSKRIPVQRIVKAILRRAVYLSKTAVDRYLSGRELVERQTILLDAARKDIDLYVQAQTQALSRVIGGSEEGISEEIVRRVDDLCTNSVVKYAMQALDSMDPKVLEQPEVEISSHWWDFFEKFIRDRNEEWRSYLLGRCLALEAIRPGEIRTSSVWKVATMEEESFHDIGDYLRYAVDVSIDEKRRGYMLIGFYLDLMKSGYTSHTGKLLVTRDLIHRLVEDGLVIEGDGSVDLDAASNCRLALGATCYEVRRGSFDDPAGEKAFLREKGALYRSRDILSEFSLFGITMTRTGTNLANLFEVTPADDADERLQAALNLMKQESGIDYLLCRPGEGSGAGE